MEAEAPKPATLNCDLVRPQFIVKPIDLQIENENENEDEEIRAVCKDFERY